MSSSDPSHATELEPDSPPQLTVLPEAVDVPEDVYQRILQQIQGAEQALDGNPQSSGQPASGGELSALRDTPVGIVPAPPAAPVSLSQAGLSPALVSDLVLKVVFLGGTLTGFDISRQLHLPFSVLTEPLDALKAERCLEVTSSEMFGRLSYRYHLTDGGRSRAREAFQTCRYVGPAPVSLSDYTQQCRAQSPRRLSFNAEQLAAVLEDLVLEPEFLRKLGPAVCGGQAIFLHGPPGTGKTAIASALGRLLNEQGGTIHVPYAVTVDQQIISIFDPQVHLDPSPVAVNRLPPPPDEPELAAPDLRWREVRRPVVATGGELSLDMLELRHHPQSGYYIAPLHIKANGGVLLLDDFGRQLVPAPQLLNRWILPLEDRHDFLTLATGKKFSIPFDTLTVFSTNLPPEQLADAAFLRRIRHKLKVAFPTEQQFREIFRRCCAQRGIKYDDWILTRLLTTRYNPQSPHKSSDPRDLLEGIDAICRFEGQPPHLSEELLCAAWDSCLGMSPASE